MMQQFEVKLNSKNTADVSLQVEGKGAVINIEC